MYLYFSLVQVGVENLIKMLELQDDMKKEKLDGTKASNTNTTTAAKTKKVGYWNQENRPCSAKFNPDGSLMTLATESDGTQMYKVRKPIVIMCFC
jgi:hypothetical protein